MNGRIVLSSGHAYQSSRPMALFWGIATPAALVAGAALNTTELLRMSWVPLVLVFCVLGSSMLFLHLSSLDGLMTLGAEAAFLAALLPQIRTGALMICWIAGVFFGTWAIWLRYAPAAEAAGQDGIAGTVAVLLRTLVDPSGGAQGLTWQTVSGVIVALGSFLAIRIGLSLAKTVFLDGYQLHRATQAISLLRTSYGLFYLLVLSLLSYPVGGFINWYAFEEGHFSAGPVIVIVFTIAVTLGIVSVRRSVSLREKFTAMVSPVQQLTEIAVPEIADWAVDVVRRVEPTRFRAMWTQTPSLHTDTVISPRVPDAAGGSEYLVLSRGRWTRPFNEQDSQLISGIVSVVARVRQNAEETSHLRTLANTDRLTGLPNYGALQSHLARLSGTAAEGRLVAIIFIDIDNFKSINDHYGHETGNEVLRTVASRMEQTIRTGDLAARVGGDEFAIVLEDVGTPERARHIADRIATRTSDPITANGNQIVVRISHGIAFSRPGQQDLSSMLETADQLMYATRGKSIATAEHAREKTSPLPTAPIDESLIIQRGILEEHVQAVYQPILDADTGTVTALEALARYTAPNLGPIPVARLIGEAHRARLLNSLTLQILRAALAATAKMREVLPTVRTVHVNFDIDQVLDAEFASTCARLVHRYPGISLVIELNELSLNAPSPALQEKVAQLAEDPQLQLGLDDLGKSHSSLLALCEYPIDVIKLDKRIIDIRNTGRAEAGVRAALALGESFHASVVVEGVETAEQSEWLRGLGARYQQGFYFSRPIPIDELIAHLSHRGSRHAAAAPRDSQSED